MLKNQLIRDHLEDYAEGMEDLWEKLENIPLSAKSGAKIGVMLAFNPVTSPIATGALIGGGILYGTYKAAKRLIE